MNTFDVVVYLALVFAMVVGFNTGLLRSAITILAYLFAMPIAVAATSLLAPQIGGKLGSPQLQNSLLFFGTFLIAGMVLGKVARMALDDTIGPEAGIGDRRGARRHGRDHAGAGFRPARPRRPPAWIPDRLAIAAAALSGGAKRPGLAAAGCRRHRQPAEAGAAELA